MKILFNRSSPIVRLMEVSGVALSILYVWKGVSAPDLTLGLFGLLFASYLFVRLCDLAAWYPRETLPRHNSRAIGIRVHFQKALVPTSYILTVSALAALLNLPILSLAVVALADLLMLVIAPVNGILIYFHHRDKDPLPMNYFSSNSYKAGEAPHPREDIEELQASVV